MANAKPAAALPIPEAMAGSFQDAARWFNQMWSSGMDAATAAQAGGPVPAAMMPTLNSKEIDKRIADLRSVEQWLQVNQGMVRTTIQVLELQRNTLEAWQSLSAAASAPAGAGNPAEEAAAGAAAMGFQPTAWWVALQQQFSQLTAQAAANARATPEATPAAAPGQATPAKAGRSAPGHSARGTKADEPGGPEAPVA